jgi:hypothetical protein
LLGSVSKAATDRAIRALWPMESAKLIARAPLEARAKA